MDYTPLDTNILRMPKSLRDQQTGGGFLSKYIKPIGQGLLTMGKQLGGAIGQGVSEGFGVVGETINKTPGLKQGVGILNAADYALGTVAKTTEGLLTKPRETLMNLKYRPGEGLKSYANRNVTDISPYVTQKVAGTQIGQKFPMVAPILGLGAGMLTPSPSDALKVGKFASQAGDVAKFSDDATELVKPKMLDPLTSEAKKYKSAEEFVNSKINYYHGTEGVFETFKPFNKVPEEFRDSSGQHTFGTYFSDNKTFAGQFGKNIMERKLDISNPIDLSGVKSFDELTYKLGINTPENKFSLNRMAADSFFDKFDKTVSPYRALEELNRRFNIIKDLKKQGYDSMIFSDVENGVNGKTIVVFDVNKIKTKSQLTDI